MKRIGKGEGTEDTSFDQPFPPGVRVRDPECQWSVSPVPLGFLETCGNTAPPMK